MQKHSFNLCKYLASSGVAVDLFFPIKDNSEAYGELKQAFSTAELRNINFHPIIKPDTVYFPGHYIYKSYLYSQAIATHFFNEEIKADLIYIQGFSGWALMKQLNKRVNQTPSVLNFHGLEIFQKSSSFRSILINAFFRPFVRRNLSLANRVQSLGGGLTEILKNEGINNEGIFELGIGISEEWLVDDQEVEINDDVPVKFVFVGRYERRKGIEELTTVLGGIIGEYNFRFDFIGPIPEKKRIKSEKIKYHGLVKSKDKIKGILSSSDILVCPSYSEGMPTVILEAMASGCAIIATGVGAVSDQVSIENGWLIQPGDQVAIRKALIEAVNSDSIRLLNMKKASIQKIKNEFLWSIMVDKHILKFRDTIEEYHNLD